MWVTKSFLWKEGIFTMILPEMNEIHVLVSCLENNRNMIVFISGTGTVFISPSNGITAWLQDGGHFSLFDGSGSFSGHSGHSSKWLIKNALPVQQDYLPGKLKKDIDGNLYYGPGINIKRLLSVYAEDPYYNISGDSIRINDQNSKGYVVGRIDTLYGYHAFLAIPQEQRTHQE